MAQLIGYYNFTSKKGTPCYVATVVKEYTQKQKADFGRVGFYSENVFLPVDLYNKLKPSDVNKEVTIGYEVNNGYASVVDFVVKQ